MPPDASHNVAIHLGNATLAGRMETFLQREGRFEVQKLEGEPPVGADVHLAIVDVDSGADAAGRWLRYFDSQGIPVVISGVEGSRSRYEDKPWVSRPFTPTRLVDCCRQVLGIEAGVDSRDQESVPPAIEPGTKESFRAQPTVEIPEDVHPDEQPQQSASSHQQAATTTRRSTQELLDVLELDGSGSMILEVEELNEEGKIGGTLVETGDRRSFSADELAGMHAAESREPTDGPDKEPSRPQPSREPSTPGSLPPGISESATTGVTAVSTLGEASGDFSGAHQVAGLVAEHWDRLGLTARPADRADRLQRVLSAMLRDGMDGVLDELKRIPPVKGFSGRLETMSIVDLLHTIRDRGLRGRLEVGLPSLSFVLYVDHTTLQDIESLGETTDAMLVNILRNHGALDETTYQQYRRLTGKLHGESLELKLRREEAVQQTQLLEAKKERAKKLLARMCRSDRGTFAFIDIPRGSSQSWPTQELNLNVDGLLLEIFREDVSQHQNEESMVRQQLVSDSTRAQSLDPEALTEAERQLLMLFEKGRSLDSVREMIDESDESLVQVVRRLRRLELLKGLGNRGSGKSTTGGGTQGEQKQPVDPDDTTASSSWNFRVVDDDFDDEG